MAIRKFRFEDVEQVYSIAASSLNEHYTLDLLFHLWSLNPDGFFVYEMDGKIVGFINSVRTGKEELRILMLAVLPAYRRRGIGSKLLSHLMLSFPEVRRFYLETRVENRDAINFYLKHGFRIKETIDDFYTDGGKAYLMEKIIF
ncbi:MAG: GNAT family N-acetyltransferase [Thermoplasmata archaeon]|nr:GNAT family N-acetyltransferase [Thermoplasmata archaeon]